MVKIIVYLNLIRTKTGKIKSATVIFYHTEYFIGRVLSDITSDLNIDKWQLNFLSKGAAQ